MIYLIGGPPTCGKSTAARRLARSLGCSWVQGDWLTQAFAAYVPDGALRPAERFELGSGVSYSTRNDILYARYSPAAIISYYRAWAVRTWPGLQVFIEGYQIDPALLPAFLAGDPSRTQLVPAVFHYREDLAETTASLRRGVGAPDWVTRRTQQESTFERIAQMII